MSNIDRLKGYGDPKPNGRQPRRTKPRASVMVVTPDEVNEAVDDPHRLARLVIAKLPPIQHYRGEFYGYLPPAYVALSDDEFRAKVVPILKAEFDRANLEALQNHVPGEDGAPPRACKITKPLLANVLEIIKAMSQVKVRLELPLWLIPESAILSGRGSCSAEWYTYASRVSRGRTIGASKADVGPIHDQLARI